MNDAPFWMVFLEGGHGPSYKHNSVESARREALRLSRIHPDVAYVLRAVESVVVSDVQWTKITDGGSKHAENCMCYDCLPF